MLLDVDLIILVDWWLINGLVLDLRGVVPILVIWVIWCSLIIVVLTLSQVSLVIYLPLPVELSHSSVSPDPQYNPHDK